MPAPLPCNFASQYVCFCSVDSGVFDNTQNCAKGIGLGLGIAFHFSIRVRVKG